MKEFSFVSRISVFSLIILNRLYFYSDIALSAFWLGILNSKKLDSASDYYYKRFGRIFQQEDYNQTGLFSWENELIINHFNKQGKILLIAAGGGREALALLKMGYDIDGYDCNNDLVALGSEILKKNGFNKTINFLPKDSLPDTLVKYDGVIIGWGAYTHMIGRKKRVDFLTRLKLFIGENAPIMLSFYTRKEDSKRIKYTYKISNFFRTIRNERKIEYGDSMDYCFVHSFTKSEIIEELNLANLQAVTYSDKEYGYLVAKA